MQLGDVAVYEAAARLGDRHDDEVPDAGNAGVLLLQPGGRMSA
ncbi:hypothetical protein [Modestobacter caceresii]|nr:hypothetical protein [Modestobacter caceresii]